MLRMNTAGVYETILARYPHTVRMMPEDTDWSTLVEDKVDEGLIDYDEVTRIEVIDLNGRAWSTDLARGVKVSLQDDNRTLKVFVK